MSPTLIVIFWIAVAIAALGTAGRIALWFLTGPPDQDLSLGKRVRASLGAIWDAIRYGGFFGILGTLLFGTLGQKRLRQRDPVRAITHGAIMVGFLGLLFLHALHSVIPEKFIPGFSSRLDPWLRLRDFFGLLVMLGLLFGSVWRRWQRRGLPTVRRRDPVFLGLLWTILVSGFLLASSKIVSAPDFDRMAKEYAAVSGDELRPLRLLWAVEYGVVFPDRPERQPFNAETLNIGRKLNDESCSSCHARPTSAIVSYPVSVALRPASPALARVDAPRWLYFVHVLACFLLLAYFPFGRFFHIVADAFTLIWDNALQGPEGFLLGAKRLEEGSRALMARLQEYEEEAKASQATRGAPLPAGLAAVPWPYGNQQVKEGLPASAPAGGTFPPPSASADRTLQAPQSSIGSQAASVAESSTAAQEPGPGTRLLSWLRGTLERRSLLEDACVRCGLCDETCSVRGLIAHKGNDFFLPSTRVLACRLLLQPAQLSAADVAALADGAFACTKCGRCTDRCPVAVSVIDLFLAETTLLSEAGFIHPEWRVAWVPPSELADIIAKAPPQPLTQETVLASLIPKAISEASPSDVFAPCVECQTCTNVCPVVAHWGSHPSPQSTPQKVMNLLRLGLRELAMVSPMVWHCATCYQCQEHCPAGIRVTDVLYELRQAAYARLLRVPPSVFPQPGGERQS